MDNFNAICAYFKLFSSPFVPYLDYTKNQFSFSKLGKNYHIMEFGAQMVFKALREQVANAG